MDRREYAVKSEGLSLHVTEWGPADGHPVVMLHGIRGYAETFAGLAAALQPECRVIGIDQRGRGGSDWDPARNYYTDAYVADLAAVADRLDLRRFDLLGHSMGGIAAIVYAAARPARVRRLVIEDAGPGAFEGSAGAERIQRELTATPAGFADWDAARAFMRALRPTVTEAAREQRLLSMLKALPDGGYTWRYDHAGIVATRLHPDPARVVDLRPHVARLACPTLVLRGGRSDYLQNASAQAMADANPNIQWNEVPDAGHYIHDDQPDIVARHVRGFLVGGDVPVAPTHRPGDAHVG
ncbi:alpha/beta fold hydrolase [Pigmentiphaga litoralis]|uniref:alpha/beta fold hydrolase n=1 Tax=Pigmentiphaga litoralis TaxID=516702 RepID=UPI003B4322B2